ncbi:neuropeptide CCHamide-1 [Lutzomyia longipalpis]|uniref:neuropeptide CCHamide-1 n=1 Tax=Lutzomyia longipalpis TaxID=7200 RepID=UPI00248377E3|nr:neuropeptide CCHamide-1 [Lutzomyia longipalpis]
MKLILSLLLVISLYKDSVEGSCLSYGHSCWGAHGKRSPPRVLPRPPPHINLPTRWALLKIIPDKNLFEMKAKIQGNPMDRINDSRFFRSLATDTVENAEDIDSLRQTQDNFDGRQGSNINLNKFFVERDSREANDVSRPDLDNEITNNDPKDAKFYKFSDADTPKIFV